MSGPFDDGVRVAPDFAFAPRAFGVELRPGVTVADHHAVCVVGGGRGDITVAHVGEHVVGGPFQRVAVPAAPAGRHDVRVAGVKAETVELAVGEPLVGAVAALHPDAVGCGRAAYVGVTLVDRIGRMPLLLGGFIIMAVGCGFGTLGVSVLDLTAWPVLFTAGMITAIGATLPAILLYMYTAELYPTRMRGWGTAAGSSMNRLASILSPILVGQILSRGGGVSVVFSTFLLAALIGLAVLALTGIETRNRPLEELAH